MSVWRIINFFKVKKQTDRAKLNDYFIKLFNI